MWDAYCTVLNERPLFTKILTGVMGTFLGDLLAQFLGSITGQGKKNQRQGQLSPVQRPLLEFDALRSARLVLFSAMVGTPLSQLWFSFLDAVSRCWGREGLMLGWRGRGMGCIHIHEDLLVKWTRVLRGTDWGFGCGNRVR